MEVLYEIPRGTAMALQTSVAFFVASCGILLVEPERGLMAPVVDPGPAGVAFRRLVPMALFVPLFLGALAVASVQQGLMSGLFAFTVLVSLLAVFEAVVIGITSQRILEVDRQRAAVRKAEQRALEELEAALDAREKLLAVVGHDLRVPLNTVVATSSLLRDGIAPPEQHQRFLEIIERSANTMSRLIQDLVDAARLERGHLSVEPVPVRVDSVVRETYAELYHHAASEGIRLECDVPEVSSIEADSDRLRQVLRNLIENAIKFTPEGGTVVVTVDEGDHAVGVAVQDQGPGIPEGDLGKLFEPYWAGESESRQKGTGLGLFIVRGLVEAHGGKVTVETTVGEGTVFRVALPKGERTRTGAGV